MISTDPPRLLKYRRLNVQVELSALLRHIHSLSFTQLMFNIICIRSGVLLNICMLTAWGARTGTASTPASHPQVPFLITCSHSSAGRCPRRLRYDLLALERTSPSRFYALFLNCVTCGGGHSGSSPEIYINSRTQRFRVARHAHSQRVVKLPRRDRHLLQYPDVSSRIAKRIPGQRGHLSYSFRENTSLC